MTVLSIVRPEIRKMSAYEAATQFDQFVRLNANEAFWNDEDNAGLNRYPEVRPTQLRRVMARHYGVGCDTVLVTRGSSEAIDVITRTFCRSNIDNIVLSSPTFGMYKVYAELQGAKTISVPTRINDQFQIDVDQLLSAADEYSKLIFICSPNNPTGRSVSRSDIARLIDARRGRSVIVVDEAYIEFSEHESVSNMTAEFDNLIVLRTTSKAMALAGTRCGCAIANQEVIQVLDSVLPPYSIPTPVSERVVAALAPHRVLVNEESIRQTTKRRQDLTIALQRLPVVKNVVPSDANFLLAKFVDATRVFQACIDAGILLRDVSAVAGLENCLRISIGSEQESEQLLSTLQSMSR